MSQTISVSCFTINEICTYKTIVLVPLGLTAAASATDAAIQKNIFGSETTALIISNEGMEDIMKIIKSHKESGLLIKGVTETIKN